MKLYKIKWTNLLTGKFGFSKTAKPLEESEAQCLRMKSLTKGRWIDDEGNKRNFRGSYEPVEVMGGGR